MRGNGHGAVSVKHNLICGLKVIPPRISDAAHAFKNRISKLSNARRSNETAEHSKQYKSVHTSPSTMIKQSQLATQSHNKPEDRAPTKSTTAT